MKNLVNLESKELISTIEFRDVINELRVQEGENKVENSKFLLRVEDELELDRRDSKTFRHPQSGAEMKYYELTEDEALQVGMRESKAVRKGVIAWIKERKKPQFQLPDFTNPAESARAWAEQFEKRKLAEEKVISLEGRIEEDRPKLLLAETLLSLEDGDGLIRPKDFAKAIESIYGVGRNTFYQILRDIKVWNKDNIPYARFVQAKYFCIKNNTFYNKYTGQNESSVVVFITPKGRQYLIGKLSSLFDVEDI